MPFCERYLAYVCRISIKLFVDFLFKKIGMLQKKVLITGAAGFLGSHLCDRFIKEGYHVLGMDNLITGAIANIQQLVKLKNFEFYHHDVSQYVAMGI